MTLNKMSEVKSNITCGFLGHDFLYDGSIYWVSTGNNKADIACFEGGVRPGCHVIQRDFACLHVARGVFTKISTSSLTYQKIVHLFLHYDMKEQCISVDSHQLHPMTTSSKEINNSRILTSKTSFKHHEFHPLNLETFLVCWCI